jgi:hypothetical protein
MGQVSFAKTHILTSTRTIIKPRRRKKRFKEDTQATNQEIITKFFINKWKLKIKILNTKSMTLKLNIQEKKDPLIVEIVFLISKSSIDGHTRFFRSLLFFI